MRLAALFVFGLFYAQISMATWESNLQHRSGSYYGSKDSLISILSVAHRSGEVLVKVFFKNIRERAKFSSELGDVESIPMGFAVSVKAGASNIGRVLEILSQIDTNLAR